MDIFKELLRLDFKLDPKQFRKKLEFFNVSESHVENFNLKEAARRINS